MQDKATQTAARPKKFKELTGQQKIAFFGKLMVFLVSFGFAFPLLLSND